MEATSRRSAPSVADPAPALRYKERVLNAACYALSLLFVLPSFAYPVGQDTAFYQYLGQGWLEGYWPYEAALDHTPPAIFAVYALGTLLLGGEPWGIHATGAIPWLLLGGVVGQILSQSVRGASAAHGIAALLIVGFCYTNFGYWSLGHTEGWVMLCMFGSWAIVRQGELTARRCCVAGVIAGLGFMFKLPSLLFAVPIALLCGWRALGARDKAGHTTFSPGLRALLWFSAGFAGMVTAFVLPFVVRGYGDELWTMLIPFNMFYRTLTGWIILATPGRFWGEHVLAYTLVVVGVFVAAAFRRARQADRDPTTLPIELSVMASSALVTVILQGHYFTYHWQVFAPILALAFLWGIHVLTLTVPPAKVQAVQASSVVAIIVLGLIASPTNGMIARDEGLNYQRQFWAAWNLVRGTESEQAYLKPFRRPWAGLCSSAASENLGRFVRARGAPTDTLCVTRTFCPSVYLVSGRRCPSRFFSDHLLRYLRESPEGSGQFHGWFDEYQRDLRRAPPTFLVSDVAKWRGAAALVGTNYQPVAQSESLILLERVADDKSTTAD